MDKNTQQIGKQIGNYHIVTETARGTYGAVYIAKQVLFADEPVVALKVLDMQLPARDHDRFLQEAQQFESLSHRSILPILDIGIYHGIPYLATKYAPGGSLRQLLNQTAPGVLNRDRALTILTQVGEALHYAHQNNLVHNDLKPENILFNAEGDAILADFGIAVILSSVSAQRLANLRGTPSYMAPEQFRGVISKEGDQYALA